MPYKVTIPRDLPELTDRKLRDWYEKESWANQKAGEAEIAEAVKDIKARVNRQTGQNETKLQDVLLEELERRDRLRAPDQLKTERKELDEAIDRVQEQIQQRRAQGYDVEDQEYRLESLANKREAVVETLKLYERQATR